MDSKSNSDGQPSSNSNATRKTHTRRESSGHLCTACDQVIQICSFSPSASEEIDVFSATGAKCDALANAQHANDVGQTVVPAHTAQGSRLGNQRAARTKSSERKHRLTSVDRQWFKVCNSRIPIRLTKQSTDSTLKLTYPGQLRRNPVPLSDPATVLCQL
jgi:hypothetical protein